MTLTRSRAASLIRATLPLVGLALGCTPIHEHESTANPDFAKRTTSPLTIDSRPWVLEAELAEPPNIKAESIAVSGDWAAAAGRADGSSDWPDVLVFGKHSGLWTLDENLNSSDPLNRDPTAGYGAAVAASGDIILVGAPGASTTGAVSARIREGWFTRPLVPNDAAPGSLFGQSLSISNDDIAVIGAPGDRGRGAVYIFTRDPRDIQGWIQLAKLTPTDTDIIGFGRSVSIARDIVVIGAGSPSTAGAAYVFVHKSGNEWRLQQKLVAETGIKNFGISVSLFQDTALIGAAEPDRTIRGAAYVFTRADSTWHQRAKISPDTAANGFGSAVGIFGDAAVVGDPTAGASYIFLNDGSSWIEVARETGKSGFGKAVAISNDQAFAVAPGDHSVTVLTRGGSSWAQTQYLRGFDTYPINATANDNTVIINARSSLTSACVYRAFVRTDSGWVDQQQLDVELATNECKGSIGLSGNTAVLNPIDEWGHSRGPQMFVRAGSTWTLQGRIATRDQLSFGSAVSISGDTLIVGAADRAMAHVFIRNGTAWTEQQRLTLHESIHDPSFGYSVNVSGDIALIGGKYDAYVFKRSGVSWTEQMQVYPDYLDNPLFVSLSGDTAVVGSDSSAIYVLLVNGAFWDSQQLYWPGIAASQPHPFSTAGNLVIIGDPEANAHPFGIGEITEGAAHVFFKHDQEWMTGPTLSGWRNRLASLGMAVSATPDTLVIQDRIGTFVLRQHDEGSPGAQCTTGDECTTGACVDGVCCDRWCDGECESCSAQLTGLSEGTCGRVHAGVRCGPNEIRCASRDQFATSSTCDANGACQPVNLSDCDGNFACIHDTSADHCASDCGAQGGYDHTLCATTHFCDGDLTGVHHGVCRPDLPAGSPCSVNEQCVSGQCSGKCLGEQGAHCQSQSECASGYCVDGVCCQEACARPCEACSLSDSDPLAGVCRKVKTPLASHPPCQGEGRCAGYCTGSDSECFYPGPAKECASASCSGALLTPARGCDNAGQCAPSIPQGCNGFACSEAGDACKTSCSTNADCESGRRCHPDTGQCVVFGATCKGGFTVVLPDGTEQSCAGHCQGEGICKDDCGSQRDCAPYHDCIGGRCTANANPATSGGASRSAADDDSGCSCRTQETRAGSSALGTKLVGFGLLGMVLLVRAGTRRSRRSNASLD